MTLFSVDAQACSPIAWPRIHVRAWMRKIFRDEARSMRPAVSFPIRRTNVFSKICCGMLIAGYRAGRIAGMQFRTHFTWRDIRLTAFQCK